MSPRNDSIKAGLQERQEADASTTSDAASHGSHINTFDSLSQFEQAGMTNHQATTFQRPKAWPHLEPA